MKRIAALALPVALMAALTLASGGCSNKESAPTPAATSSPISTDAPAPAQDSSAGSTASTSAASDIAIPEQVSETEGSAASSSAGSTSASLALKMTETPAEPASKWKEGVNYTRLSPVQPTSAPPGQIEVMEVFWYGCPHCYALDPYLETWRKNKAANISFVRVPVMWSPGHKAHARVFYTAELLGKLDTLHSVIFDEMQVRNNPMNSNTLIEQFFLSQGISKADFQKAYSSFAVESSLSRAEAIGVRYKVDSVPMIIINGKYVTDVGKAGGHTQLISLINDLAQRETAN